MRRKEEESVLSEKERGREWVKRERERNRVGEEKKSWDEEKSYENPKRGEENKKEEGRKTSRKHVIIIDSSEAVEWISISAVPIARGEA